MPLLNSVFLRLMKKRFKKESSLVVIRAVNRLNNHSNKKASRFVIYVGKQAIKYFPVTSQ
ncbi:MAG: hypothetical protein CMG74_12200 [Candidatus Marinimicrobia bacterium]|nr:hypothetical protein [Candidatus Neomarinimicrobiota bacterium]|tara:strand:- start:1416 stop:1595 length:180 start_codon:yes stop_codon:yes gene_type:complete